LPSLFFVQCFPIDEGKKFSNKAFIKINNQKAILDSDFFALSNSGLGNFISKASITLNEAKQVWFTTLALALASMRFTEVWQLARTRPGVCVALRTPRRLQVPWMPSVISLRHRCNPGMLSFAPAPL
jgi:hypothetical protein